MNFILKVTAVKLIYCITLVICVYLSPSNLYSQQTLKSKNNQAAITDYIDFYQKYISSIRGSNCQMHPSCSNFGLNSFKSFNPFEATILTADRMLRCSHDVRFYQKTLTSDGSRLVDFSLNDTSELNEILYQNENVILFSAIDTSESGQFISYLIMNKHYREALLEINRIIYSSKIEISKSIYLNYLVCKRALNEQESAIFEFQNSFPIKIQKEPEILNEIGKLYFDINSYSTALEYYNRSINNSRDSAIIDKALLLKGLLLACEKKWTECNNNFELISNTSPYITSKINSLYVLKQHEQERYKKPYLAGLLSIIPGMGYAYAGHNQTAISSLVINGLLGYATYSNIKNENYGMAALTGLFSFSFYIGNINGSIQSAKRYNSTIDKRTIRKLKKSIFY